MLHPGQDPATLKAGPVEEDVRKKWKKKTREEFLKYLDEEAGKRGLSVREYTWIDEHRRRRVRKTLAHIGGVLCGVYLVTSTKFSHCSDMPHVRPGFTRSALENTRVTIVFQESPLFPPNLFLVPSSALLKKFRGKDEQKRFYIPHRPFRHRRSPENMFDWFAHKDQWDIFSLLKKTASAATG